MRKFQIYQDEVGSKGMSFHPHSLVLTHLNLCEQEAKNIPFDLYDQVKTANKDFNENWVGHLKSLPIGFRTFFSELAHETDHFNRMLGTSHGLLYQTLEQNHISTNMGLIAYREKNNFTDRSAPFPLFKPSFFQAQYKDLLNNHYENLKNQYASTHFLTGGMNFLLRSLNHSSKGDYYPAIWYALFILVKTWKEHYGNKSREFDHDLMNIMNNKNTSPLFFKAENLPTHLSSIHLLEFMAVINQLNYDSMAGLPTERLVDFIFPKSLTNNVKKPGFSEYNLLFSYWFNRFPIISGKNHHIEHYSTEFGSWGFFPLELYAAIDLALWPPFGPYGFMNTPGTVDSPVSWLEIQPGWRFVQIMHKIKFTKKKFTNFAFADVDEKIETMQELWCKALNWATPKSISNAWLKALNNRKEGESTVIDFMSQEKKSTIEYLLDIRNRTPGLSIFNMFKNNSVIRSFPAYALSTSEENDSGIIVKTTSSDVGLKAEVDYIFQKSIRRLTYGTQVNIGFSKSSKSKAEQWIKENLTEYWIENQESLLYWI